MRVIRIKKAVSVGTITASSPKIKELLYICKTTRVNSHVRLLEMAELYMKKGWYDWAYIELEKAEKERVRLEGLYV